MDPSRTKLEIAIEPDLYIQKGVRVNPHALQDETLQRQPQETNDTVHRAQWNLCGQAESCSAKGTKRRNNMGKNGIGEVRQTGLSVTREAVSVRCNQKAEKTWNLSFIKKSPCVRDGGPPSEDCASIFSMQGDSKCLVEPASFERRWFPSPSSNRRAQRVPGGYGRWAPAPANCFSNQWEELKALCLTLRVGVEESTCFGFIIGSSSFTCCGRSSNAALSKTGRSPEYSPTRHLFFF